MNLQVSEKHFFATDLYAATTARSQALVDAVAEGHPVDRFPDHWNVACETGMRRCFDSELGCLARGLRLGAGPAEDSEHIRRSLKVRPEYLNRFALGDVPRHLGERAS